MSDSHEWKERLQRYLHDPIDKCFDIQGHEERARKRAQQLGITLSGEERYRFADVIASCMERALLPRGASQELRIPCSEVRHPLTGNHIPLNISRDPDNVPKEFDKIWQEKVKEHFVRLKDDREKFLWLWRNLPEIYIQNLSDKLKKYILLLPADTRIPDHSIWEHLKITSATKAYEKWQCNSLFIFTIGPVQRFIQQARKTHDYYMGSFLLSYLTFRAMIPVIEEFGPQAIIFPDLFRQPLMDWWLLNKKKIQIHLENAYDRWVIHPTLPNRFVALLPLCSKDEIEQVGNEVEGAVQEVLGAISKSLLNWLKSIKSVSGEWEKQWEKQWFSHFQCYWAGISWRKGGNNIKLHDFEGFIPQEEVQHIQQVWETAEKHGEHPPNVGMLYSLLYQMLERGLAGRRNARSFSSLCEQGRKCSVCGERNVLIGRELPVHALNFTEPQPVNITTGDNSISYRYLQDGEGLCAVCFTKRALDRYLQEEVSTVFETLYFPSTGEVAIADWKEKLCKLRKEDEQAEKHYQTLVCVYSELNTDKNVAFCDALPSLAKSYNIKRQDNIDGWVLLSEPFRSLQDLKEIFGEGVATQLDERTLTELSRAWQELKGRLGEPFPYFALIAMDGDRMGEWLSGHTLPALKNLYSTDAWAKIESSFQEFKKALSDAGILDKPRPLTPAVHAFISTALRNFSLELVVPIVEEQFLGKLIYAGGDDVLAMVNIRDVLGVVRHLRAAFSGQIEWKDGRVQVNWENKCGFVEKDGVLLPLMGHKATASAGVVIAHYKTPLRLVIEQAYKMEKKAKSLGRDRWAVALMRHSGSVTECVMPWRLKEGDVIEKVMEVIQAIHPGKGSFSDTFIHMLQEEFGSMRDVRDIDNGLRLMLEAEIRRLVRRARKSRDTEEQEVNRLVETLTFLLDAAREGNPHTPLDNFFALLDFIRFAGRRAQYPSEIRAKTPMHEQHS